MNEYFTILGRSQHSTHPHRLCLVPTTLSPILTAFACLHRSCSPPILTAFCICHVVFVPDVGVCGSCVRYCHHVVSSSLGDIVVVGRTLVIWPHRRRHGQWAIACSHGVVPYAGIGKRGGLWDGMCGAVAKMNHDKRRGSCFVTHLLPWTVSWSRPYRIVAPRNEVGTPHRGWLVTLALGRGAVSWMDGIKK